MRNNFFRNTFKYILIFFVSLFVSVSSLVVSIILIKINPGGTILLILLISLFIYYYKKDFDFSSMLITIVSVFTVYLSDLLKEYIPFIAAVVLLASVFWFNIIYKFWKKNRNDYENNFIYGHEYDDEYDEYDNEYDEYDNEYNNKYNSKYHN